MAKQDACTHCHHKRENHMAVLHDGGPTVIFLIAIVTGLKIENH